MSETKAIFDGGIFCGPGVYPHLTDHGVRIIDHTVDDSLNDRVRRLEDLAKRFPGAIIAGHSTGCLVALRVAKLVGDQRRVKLFAPVHMPGQFLTPKVVFTLARYLRFRPCLARARDAMRLFFNVAGDFTQHLVLESPKVLWKLALLQTMRWKRNDFIPDFGTEIDIFVGDQDQATPVSLARKTARVLGVDSKHFHVLKGRDHFPFLDGPESRNFWRNVVA